LEVGGGEKRSRRGAYRYMLALESGRYVDQSRRKKRVLVLVCHHHLTQQGLRMGD